MLAIQLCPTLCDPMNCSPPGSSVHGILQARILEWVAIPFSRDLSNPEIKPRSPALQVDSLLSEPPEKPREMDYIPNYTVFGRACCKFGTLYMSKSNSSTEPA